MNTKTGIIPMFEIKKPENPIPIPGSHAEESIGSTRMIADGFYDPTYDRPVIRFVNMKTGKIEWWTNQHPGARART